MSKDTSFRLCMALLLVVQAGCWALMLINLFSPGQPLHMLRSTTALFRNSTIVLPQAFTRKASALLHYRDI